MYITTSVRNSSLRSSWWNKVRGILQPVIQVIISDVIEERNVAWACTV